LFVASGGLRDERIITETGLVSLIAR